MGRIMLPHITDGWRDAERYVCRCGNFYVPSEKDGSDTEQGAVPERRENDHRRLPVRVVTITDNTEVFKQGAFPKNVQHESQIEEVVSVKPSSRERRSLDKPVGQVTHTAR